MDIYVNQEGLKVSGTCSLTKENWGHSSLGKFEGFLNTPDTNELELKGTWSDNVDFSIKVTYDDDSQSSCSGLYSNHSQQIYGTVKGTRKEQPQ